MCGGYTTPEGWQEVHLDLHPDSAPLARRYAVRPFDSAPIVVFAEPFPRGICADQWSLIPPDSESPRPRYSTFNARVERLRDSPLWRRVLSQRCLVPADGFYERVPVPGSRQKQPWYVRRRDHAAVLFAGLWSRWQGPDGDTLIGFTVVTTPANALLAHIGHPRSPAVVPPALYGDWIDPDPADLDTLIAAIATPSPARQWEAWPVSHAVNYRDRNGPELIAPVGDTVRLDD